MTSRLLSVRIRLVSERERTRMLAGLGVVLLLCATTVLILTRPTPQHVVRVEASMPSPTTAPAVGGVSWPVVQHASSRFLAGYLAYIYGHASVQQIAGATRGLARSLTIDPPRVSPAMREHHPRLLSLQSTPGRAGQTVVSALINDGSLIDYTIDLTLTSSEGQLLVSRVDGGS